MKVCIATTNFPRWVGDFRVPFILEAARAISDQGNKVKVLTMHTPGAAIHECFEDIEVFRAKYLPEKMEVLQKDASGIPEAWRRGFLQKLSTIPFLISFVHLLGKHAKGSDIIHCNWTLSGLAAFLSQHRHKVPYIITVQGSDIFKTIHIPIVRNLVGLALRKSAHIIALSEDLKSVTTQFDVPSEKITVIPNGVNIEQFPMGDQSHRKKQIIYVGSLITRKGVNYLIEAMSLLKDKYPDYRLLLIGEGSERAAFENLAAKLGLGDSVDFLGTQSQTMVGNYLRESRLFVLPSIEEGQGVVLIEAMASGTPCVGSRVGGIPDVINSGAGKLVEARDVEGLAAAIESFIEDDGLWFEASSKACERVLNEYSWKALSEKISMVYQRVLGKENG